MPGLCIREEEREEQRVQLVLDRLKSQMLDILYSNRAIYYCPTCDAMAYIGKLPFFKPAPWRTDIFSWRNPSVNVRAKQAESAKLSERASKRETSRAKSGPEE